MSINSWVWREMNDSNISCSKGPSGTLVNTQDVEVVVNIIKNNSTVDLEDNTAIQSKKTEMCKITKNNQGCKKRQKKK